MQLISSIRRFFAVVGLFGLILCSWTGAARSQTVSLNCTTTMTSVAFGSIDVLGGAGATSSATLSISCASLTALGGQTLYVCFALPPRGMTGASTNATLAFDMFGPSPATTSWSNASPFAVAFSTLQFGGTYKMNIPAAIAASQQQVPPDNYSQTLTATVTYSAYNSCSSGVLATGSLTFAATAAVIKNCNISANDLGFGSVTSLAAAVIKQSMLNVTCSKGLGYTIALNNGLAGATNPTARLMRSGSNSITYGLYRGSGCTLPWGWTGSTVASATGTAALQSVPIYGCVPPQTTPAPGTYTDTIVATVTY